MKAYLQEGRLLKVYTGGSHEVFHVVFPPQTGEEHQHHHIKYDYESRELFGQEPCWHTIKNPCPAIEQLQRES